MLGPQPVGQLPQLRGRFDAEIRPQQRPGLLVRAEGGGGAPGPGQREQVHPVQRLAVRIRPQPGHQLRQQLGVPPGGQLRRQALLDHTLPQGRQRGPLGGGQERPDAAERLALPEIAGPAQQRGGGRGVVRAAGLVAQPVRGGHVHARAVQAVAVREGDHRGPEAAAAQPGHLVVHLVAGGGRRGVAPQSVH